MVLSGDFALYCILRIEIVSVLTSLYFHAKCIFPKNCSHHPERLRFPIFIRSLHDLAEDRYQRLCKPEGECELGSGHKKLRRQAFEET